MSSDVEKLKAEVQLALCQRRDKGDVFTYYELCVLVRKIVRSDRIEGKFINRIVDDFLQKNRRQGLIHCRREGRTFLWMLNPCEASHA